MGSRLLKATVAAAALASLSYAARRQHRLAHADFEASPRFDVYGDPKAPPLVLVRGRA